MLENHKEQLLNRGIAPEEIKKQLMAFEHGFEAIRLERPCTPDDGIICLTESEEQKCESTFEEALSTKSMLKFVPASGAASRMFKHLFQFDSDKTTTLQEEFKAGIYRMPFVEQLKSSLKESGWSLDEAVEKNNWGVIVDHVLNHLKFGSIPKGMVLFHRYGDSTRTAFEEHLHEGVECFGNKNKFVAIHFTVPAGFEQDIEAFLKEKIDADQFGDNTFELSYSVQWPKTDTIAVLQNNEPALENGNLLFRPGGHGALIHNLNQVSADFVFIKNIDNVVTDNNRASGNRYKKILGGLCVDVKAQIDAVLKSIDSGDKIPTEIVKNLVAVLGLSTEVAINRDALYAALNKPLRVCGMVKNQGEPGGGPFWVIDSNNRKSKQIVEKAQIDVSDPNQKAVLDESTHFNPVDLVCAFRNHRGEAYDLTRFIDENTGFISEKSVGDLEVKALELPGLWNGAMAHWNTIFVEVPLSTFNPVKTVNDLLRPMHNS